jgi:hypothetical protein
MPSKVTENAEKDPREQITTYLDTQLAGIRVELDDLNTVTQKHDLQGSTASVAPEIGARRIKLAGYAERLSAASEKLAAGTADAREQTKQILEENRESYQERLDKIESAIALGKLEAFMSPQEKSLFEKSESEEKKLQELEEESTRQGRIFRNSERFLSQPELDKYAANLGREYTKSPLETTKKVMGGRFNGDTPLAVEELIQERTRNVEYTKKNAQEDISRIEIEKDKLLQRRSQRMELEEKISKDLEATTKEISQEIAALDALLEILNTEL